MQRFPSHSINNNKQLWSKFKISFNWVNQESCMKQPIIINCFTNKLNNSVTNWDLKVFAMAIEDACLCLPDQAPVVPFPWKALCHSSRHPAFGSVPSIEAKQCQWTPQEHINDQGNHGSARSSLSSLGCPNNPSICQHRERHLVLSHRTQRRIKPWKGRKGTPARRNVLPSSLSCLLPCLDLSQKIIVANQRPVHSRFLPQMQLMITMTGFMHSLLFLCSCPSTRQ